MDNKKIIYVHTGNWPTPAPSIIFATGTAYGLAHHSPTILIIRNKSEESTAEIFHYITGFDIPDNLEINRIGYGGKTPGHFGFFRETVRLIVSLAKKGEVRAVITRDIGFLPYLAYIRWRYKLPCFFETHDFFGDLSLRTDLKKTPEILKKHLYEKTILRCLDGIICLTECQAGFYGNFYPSVPRTVAHTGLLHVQRKENKREKQMCYIGSLDAHKGLGIALSAIAQTADMDIKLLVIGGRNQREKNELMEFARMMGIEDRVHISSWIHHSDIGFRIDTCIGGIVPLRDTPFNRHFTSPLKILDYLAHSLPVIASDLPPVREYIEDGKHGILFEPDNPESLANALDLYIARNDYESMSLEVETHAEKFLWTERGKKIITFINDNSL